MRQLGLKTCAVLACALAFALAIGCRSAPEPLAPTVTTPATAEPSLQPEPPEPGAPQHAPAPPGEPAIPIYDASAKTIEVASGARFIVALPANIATPMRWRIEPTPAVGVLSTPTESYHDAPPADCAGCTGYPGTRVFAFEALGVGKTTLRLVYRSLTDAKAKPEQEVVIEVTVK